MQSTSNLLQRSTFKSSAESSEPQLQLQSVTTTQGFTFPTIYSFPPFFTQQPNSTTWSHQLIQWSTLILAYCRYHRIFALELSSASCETELFRNKVIDRRIKLDTLRTIVDSMVMAGTAAYDPPRVSSKVPATGALIYWRTPEEWSQLIYSWIDEQGLTNSIMTFYELTIGGDLAESTEFYNLPIPLLRKALEVLTKLGKAQVFRGTAEGDEGDGVKFI